MSNVNVIQTANSPLHPTPNTHTPTHPPPHAPHTPPHYRMDERALEIQACVAVGDASPQELDDSQPMCLLAFHWFLAWHKHILLDGPKPPPINNTPLLPPLLVPTASPNGIEGLNGVFIHEHVWATLVNKYGGGPKYTRKHFLHNHNPLPDAEETETSGRTDGEGSGPSHVAFHVCTVTKPAPLPSPATPSTPATASPARRETSYFDDGLSDGEDDQEAALVAGSYASDALSAVMTTMVIPPSTTVGEFQAMVASHFFPHLPQENLEYVRIFLFEYYSHKAIPLSAEQASSSLITSHVAEDQLILVTPEMSVTTGRLLSVMEEKLSTVDATLAAIKALRREPTSKPVIDQLANLWTAQSPQGAVQCSRRPIIFGLIMVMCNTSWTHHLTDELEEEAAAYAISLIYELLKRNDFAVEFDHVVKLPHLRRLALHILSASSLMTELALLLVELIHVRCPSLRGLAASLDKATHAELLSFFTARVRTLGTSPSDISLSPEAAGLIALYPFELRTYEPAVEAFLKPDAGSPMATLPIPDVKALSLGPQGKDHPATEYLSSVQNRHSRLMARLSEAMEKFHKHSSGVEGYQAQLAQMGQSQEGPSKRAGVLLSRKIKSESHRRDVAADSLAEIKAEVESVEWQIEVISLIALVYALVESALAEDALPASASSPALTAEYTSWQRELNTLAADVVSATTYVGMVGLMKAGKSSTISGLVGYDICPSRSTAMTVIPTLITHVEGMAEPTLTIPESTCVILNTTLAVLGAHFSSMENLPVSHIPDAIKATTTTSSSSSSSASGTSSAAPASSDSLDASASSVEEPVVVDGTGEDSHNNNTSGEGGSGEGGTEGVLEEEGGSVVEGVAGSQEEEGGAAAEGVVGSQEEEGGGEGGEEEGGEKPSLFGNKVIDDVVSLILSGSLHFSPRPVVGEEAIQDTLVKLNDVIRLCEYVHVDGANPLLHIKDLRDLPQVELEFAVMAETGMFGRLSFIDSPGPNEDRMEVLSDVVKRILKQASIVAIVLNYAALNSEEQVRINEMIADATADLQQDAYVFVNKFDQRNATSGDMDENQVKDYVLGNLTFGRGSVKLRRQNIFPVSAKFAQYANTARKHIVSLGTQDDIGLDSGEPHGGARLEDSDSDDDDEKSGGDGGGGGGDGSDSSSISISISLSSSDDDDDDDEDEDGRGDDRFEDGLGGLGALASHMDEIRVPDPDLHPWVEDFARIAWGETWRDDNVYPAMQATNDLETFFQGVQAVWRNSNLNEPLESMLRHCYTNAGVISLRSGLMKAGVVASKLERDVQMQLATVSSSVVSLEKFLEVSSSAHEDILSAIRDIKEHAASRALEELPSSIESVLAAAEGRVGDMTSADGLVTLLQTYAGDDPDAESLEAALESSSPISFEGQSQADSIIDKLTHVFEQGARDLQNEVISAIVNAVHEVNENMNQMVQDRLQPHIAQYQRDLDEILGTTIQFPDISAPDLDLFGSSIKGDTLRLMEQQTTTKLAVYWLFKFIPIPRLRRQRKSTYSVDPTLIKEAFSKGLSQVLQSTLSASSSLSSQMLQSAVDNYTDKVERELHKLIARITLSIENKRSRHDRSVLVKQECEETLWKFSEFHKRASDLVAAMDGRLMEEAGGGGGKGGGGGGGGHDGAGRALVGLSALPRTSMLFPRTFEYSEAVIDAAVLPLNSLIALNAAADDSLTSSRFSGANASSPSSIAIRNAVFGAAPLRELPEELKDVARSSSVFLEEDAVEFEEEAVARSAWGVVTRGRVSNAVEVAVKKFLLCTPDSVERVIRRVTELWNLSHGSLVPYIGFTLAGAGLAVCTKLVPGRTLESWLAREDLEESEFTQRVPLATRVGWARRLAQGLAAVHQHKLVASVLTPRHVLLPEDAPDSVQMLIDGGLDKLRFADASAAVADSLANVDRMRKSLPLRSDREVLRALYLAPEIVDDWVNGGMEEEELEVTPATDVYAFGMILYQLFSGRGFHPAFAAAHRKGWSPEWRVDMSVLPVEVVGVVEACLVGVGDRVGSDELESMLRALDIAPA